MEERKYLVLAFYLLGSITDPKQCVRRFLRFFHTKDMRGRIYISEEGINAQMSLLREDKELFYDFLLLEDSRFSEVDIKVQSYHTHTFPRMTVKYRKQLVALDRKVDLSKKGEYLSPAKWAEKLDHKGENTIVVDVRNDYEWEVGHFEGSIRPNCQYFRKFPELAKKLQHQYNREETEVMMFCTGGIRCEFYSSLLKEEGFTKVYQLEGGIIRYGLEEGARHWSGHLFVFDDRLVIPIKEGEKAETIGICSFCKEKTYFYYNCANMECNDLFLSCRTCIGKQMGCCSSACLDSPKRREFVLRERPIPFPRLSSKKSK